LAHSKVDHQLGRSHLKTDLQTEVKVYLDSAWL